MVDTEMKLGAHTWFAWFLSALFLGMANGPVLSQVSDMGTANAFEPEEGTEFVVRQFRFMGNTEVSTDELSKIVAPLTNRPITVLELERARVDVTILYVNKGYINSGARIDSRPDAEGVARIQIIEGGLTVSRIHSNHWFRTSFYQRRLADLRSKPLRTQDLRDRLQVWRNTYPLERVHGELRPGAAPGEAVLDLTVEERVPFQLGTQYANDRPPSTGSEQVTIMAQADSLTKRGDQLALSYGVVRGGTPGLQDADLLGVDDLSASYNLPLDAHDTTLGIQYSRSSSAIVEARFVELDITSESEVFGFSLTRPLFRSAKQELSLALASERKRTQTYLFDLPYSLSPGSIEGESIVTAVRFSGQYVHRGPNHVLAARLTLSLGLDAIDATRQDIGPDGKFCAVLPQIKYVQRFKDPNFRMIVRGFGQYTPDPLLGIEQMALGGAGTVRGYRENTLVRDRAVFGSLELEYTAWRRPAGDPILRLVPFVSVGAGWDNEFPTSSPKSISSAGIGLIVTPCKHFEGSLFWGHPFRELDYAETDLQDRGIHLRIGVWAF